MRSCTNGGYIFYGFRSVDETATGRAAKKEFLKKLFALPGSQGGLSHKWQPSEMFFEFYRYLIGGGVFNAHNGWTDFNTDEDTNLNDDFPSRSWDTLIEDGTAYVSPILGNMVCSKIYTVNIAFGTINDDAESDAAIEDTIAGGGMGLTNLSKSANTRFEQVLSFLSSPATDLSASVAGTQNVTSYFIVPQPNNTENAFANAGGTAKAFRLSDDPQELVDTLTGILSQILSTSTTFVAASIPVNVFNRAEIVDNIYIALFKANPQGRPRWPGNLKKLKLGQDVNNETLLVDVDGAAAVASDGRIASNALTFWTDADALPPPNLVASPGDVPEVQGADGRSVTRGGAGQKIPGVSPGISGSGASDSNGSDPKRRTIFTEPDSIPATLRALNADASTAGDFWNLLNNSGWSSSQSYSSATDADKAEAVGILKFCRGMDVNNEDIDNSATDVVPVKQSCGVTLTNTSCPGFVPWLMGDPLHSRPLPLNYGARNGYTTSNPDIRILMGSNDGYIRMFRNTTAAGGEDGSEVWAFAPHAAISKLKRLKDNEAGAPVHPYTVDGAPVAYVMDANGNGTIEPGDPDYDKVWVYFGLRRGGHAYYGLDVSDPDAPKMLWRLEKGGDFGELGYTFSPARVGRLSFIANSTTETRPVLVFGGGYDLNKDARPPSNVDDAEGNAVYVVNAETGALIWKAVKGSGEAGNVSNTKYEHPDLRDSISSDVAAIDTDGDGLLDRAYVGDTGGVLWRVDLAGVDRANWKITPVLSVGRHFSSDPKSDRRFFHRPDVVQGKDESGAFDAVILTSGDRANPLDKGLDSAVENVAYMFKDRNTVSGTPPGETKTQSDLADLSSNCLQDGSCSSPPDLENGWRIALEKPGEKGLATPTTIAGTIFFTTYLPPHSYDETTCAPKEGGGQLYAISLLDATARFATDGGKLEPVEDPTTLPTSARTLQLRSAGIPAEVVTVGPDLILLPDLSVQNTGLKTTFKTFWHEMGQ